MPRNRPEHPHVLDAGQRRARHRLARCVLRDKGERLRVAEHLDSRQRLALAETLEGFERDVAQHFQRLIADRFVAIGARRFGQGRRIHQLRHRRPPDPRVLIVARDRRQLFSIVDRDLLDKRQPHGRIRMLVPRLRFESVE